MAPQSGASEAASDAQPTQQFRLPVSDLHELSVLEYGNPKGIPAVFLHGGPGAGVSAKQVASFDLDTYRVITFDQRGAGRSTPAAEIAENTTQHLIMDMETLREKLDIERWLVAGAPGDPVLRLPMAWHTRSVASAFGCTAYFSAGRKMSIGGSMAVGLFFQTTGRNLPNSCRQANAAIYLPLIISG